MKSAEVKKITSILFAEEIEPCIQFWTEKMGFQKTIEVPEGNKIGFVASGEEWDRAYVPEFCQRGQRQRRNRLCRAKRTKHSVHRGRQPRCSIGSDPRSRTCDACTNDLLSGERVWHSRSCRTLLDLCAAGSGRTELIATRLIFNACYCAALGCYICG